VHAFLITAFALLAQAASPQMDGSAKLQAQALVNEASTLFEAGNLPGALEKFNAAYSVFPSPKILFNLGQVNREMGRSVEALRAYEGFLAGVPDAQPGVTAEAHRALGELQSQLARVRVECNLAGADVSLDGRPLGRTPLSEIVWTTPGRHQISARHPGAIPAVEDLDVLAGEVRTLMLTLSALPKPVARSKQVTLVPAPPPARENKAAAGWWLGRTWTWVAAGSAVALAGGATGFGLAMRSRYDELKNTCGAGAGANWPGCSDGDLRGLNTRRDVANSLWVAAAAATVGAGVLFFVEGRPATVAPMAGSVNGMQMAVRF
jgi:hypothetical protein